MYKHIIICHLGLASSTCRFLCVKSEYVYDNKILQPIPCWTHSFSSTGFFSDVAAATRFLLHNIQLVFWSRTFNLPYIKAENVLFETVPGSDKRQIEWRATFDGVIIIEVHSVKATVYWIVINNKIARQIHDIWVSEVRFCWKKLRVGIAGVALSKEIKLFVFRRQNSKYDT